jgi:hypothetical protein
MAWFPFDASFYGGSNADDATALLSPTQSADSTPYDGTVSGATYQSTGGLTDINAGTSSGYYEFNQDTINIAHNGNAALGSGSVTFWAKPVPGGSGLEGILGSDYYERNISGGFRVYKRNATDLLFWTNGSGQDKALDIDNAFTTDTWQHIALTNSAGFIRGYKNAVQIDSGTGSGVPFDSDAFKLGTDYQNQYKGDLEDVRFYNKVLSDAEVESIVQNTQDPNSPVFP